MPACAERYAPTVPSSSPGRCCVTSIGRRRRSGSRPTRGARSTCSARRRATFTVARPPLRARDRRGPRAGTRRRTRCALDGSTVWPQPRARTLPASCDPDARRSGPLPVVVRLVPHRRAARTTVDARARERPARSRRRCAVRPRAADARQATDDVAAPRGVPRRSGVRRRFVAGARAEKVHERRQQIEAVEDELPDDHVDGFEEYTWLYHESWSPEVERWFFSVVPSAMIFDDHDMIDDWNISASVGRGDPHEPWWDEHVVGGLMTYWIYQHLGNLDPTTIRDEGMLAELLAADDATDGAARVGRADRTTARAASVATGSATSATSAPCAW